MGVEGFWLLGATSAKESEEPGGLFHQKGKFRGVVDGSALLHKHLPYCCFVRQTPKGEECYLDSNMLLAKVVSALFKYVLEWVVELIVVFDGKEPPAKTKVARAIRAKVFHCSRLMSFFFFFFFFAH